MQKIVFCDVVYMKRYQGIKSDDKPGKGFNNTIDGVNECYNFIPNNHICYGYVSNNNQPININRIANVGNNISVIHDVTVVWTAISDNVHKIVGWYEHADVYRKCKIFADDTLGDEKHTNWKYYFETNEKSVYIIPENERKFEISPDESGSNIWYADSDNVRAEFVPKVLKYLKNMRKSCIQPFIPVGVLNKAISDEYSDDKTLFEKACSLSDAGKNIEAIQIFNLLESQVTEPLDICRIKFLHGWALNRIMLYDEAIEIYRQVLKTFEQVENYTREPLVLDCMWRLAWLYQRTQQYPSAWSLYEKLYNFEHEIGDRLDALLHLMWIATDRKEWNKLQIVINTYDSLNTNEMFKEVNEYKKILQVINK